MLKKDKLKKIKEIIRLRQAKGEPFRKVKIKGLKRQLAENLKSDPEFIGDFVLKEGYYEHKPYLQIYTKKTWKKHINWIDKQKKVINSFPLDKTS